jgi:hypothetical protein
MAELKGPLTQEVCTGTEYADFKACVQEGYLATTGEVLSGGIDESFMNHGDRVLGYCPSSCTPQYMFQGHYCFVMCTGRRRLEQGTEKTGLRRLQTSDEAHFVNGALVSGGGEAEAIGNIFITCFATHSEKDPCIGGMDEMELTITM